MPLERASWWAFRRAQSRKPSTYRCSLCGRHLLPGEEHMLISPEGDMSRRRHAHIVCALAARKAGRLPSREEWEATQPRSPSALAGLWARLARRR